MSRHPALHELYRPIIATPFRQSAGYTELAPCPALRPYIRCFWGTTEPVRPAAQPGLVIPDTCMDIIFTLDHTHQTVSGCFCPLDENAFSSTGAAGAPVVSTFAIRFYAWTAALFAEPPLTGTKNQFYDAADFFPALCRLLIPMLLSVPSLRERAATAGGYLLRSLDGVGRSDALLCAIDDTISARGTVRIADLTARQAVSRKRLERLFNERMGLSPKSFASLVRYQLLWQDLCFGRGGSMLDLVEKYGYFDQAHLLNDFRKRHTMTPAEAVRLARG